MRALTLEEVDTVAGGKMTKEEKIDAKIEKLEDKLDELDSDSKRAGKLEAKLEKLRGKLSVYI